MENNDAKLKEKITSLKGFKKKFSGLHFNEFIIQCPDAKKIQTKLLQNGIHGGLNLDDIFPELKNCILFGVTENHSQKNIEKLLTILQEDF